MGLFHCVICAAGSFFVKISVDGRPSSMSCCETISNHTRKLLSTNSDFENNLVIDATHEKENMTLGATFTNMVQP